MAIYSLNLGFVSRSEGRSSVGFAAYNAGEKAHDERTGKSYDFSHKTEVLVSRVLLPEGAPAWMMDRKKLWNAVEKLEDHIADLRFQGGEKSQLAKEKFINSAQTAQTVMGAIPIEFTKEQSEKCVEEFLKTRFVSRGLVVDYGIHWEEGNPHFHGIITRRPIVEGTFSKRKDSEIVSKAEHNQTRKMWEDVANKHLEKAGLEVRIDARSNADRGSFFMATSHEGWHAQRLAEDGKYARIVHENEEVRQKNIQLIAEKPQILIHELTLKRTTFTRKHLEEEIIKRVGGDEKLFEILREGLLKQDWGKFARKSDIGHVVQKFTDHLLKDPEKTHFVGENIDGDKIYTSQTLKVQEETILKYADQLNMRERDLSKELVDQAISQRENELKNPLTEEQKTAVYHLCRGSDIRILNGKAGTGKTTLLKAVAEAYQAQGYEVLGTSFQGKVVDIMQAEIGIPCRTLDSFIYQWNKHAKVKAQLESGKLWGAPYLKAHQQMKQLEKHFFHEKNVLILDEANMIGARLWEPFLKEATDRGAKVLYVQDQAQIKSREPGDVGRLLSDRFGAEEVSTVIRQRVEWQAKCSERLNEHQILDGLRPYQEKGHIGWFETTVQAKEKLSADFVKSYLQNKNQLALTYTNEEVRDLNLSIRANLKEAGVLKEHHKLGEDEYSLKDKIRFTENDNHGQHVRPVMQSFKDLFRSHPVKGVKNGTTGYIESIRPSKVVVTLDDGRKVSFNPTEYTAFTHGYAMTVNKAEGSTVDGTFVLPNRQMDPHTTLVSMTRHRMEVGMYASREIFVDFKDLVDTLSKGHFHETLQDYKVTSAQQPYLDRVRQYKDLLIEAVTLREEMEGSLKPNEPLYKHKAYEAYQLCYVHKKETAELILQDWTHHKPFTRLAGIRKDVLEVETGLRPRLLSDLEQKAAIQVEGYKDIVRTASSLWSVIQETHPSSLSKDHKVYAQYDALRQERDSIAYEFKNSPKLYQQFFREEDRQSKVYWAAVDSHAKSFEKSLDETRYINGLSAQGKESYALLKSYREVKSQVGTLYNGLLRDKDPVTSPLEKTEIVSGVIENSNLPKEKGEIQISPALREAWEVLLPTKTALRDMRALEVFRKFEEVSIHLDRVAVDEDGLLKHAIRGEIREKIAHYLSTTDFPLRATSAKNLHEALQEKSHYHIVKESGIILHRLEFDITVGEAIEAKTLPASTDVEKIYTSIEAYLTTNREIGKIWKLLKEEGNSTGDELTTFRTARDICAKNIVENEETHTVFALMRPEIAQKLPLQVKASQIRNLCKAYLAEANPLSKASAAQTLHETLKSFEEKSLYHTLKENGMTLQRVEFDMAVGKGIEAKALPASADVEKLYSPIEAYLTAHRHVGKIWNLMKEEGDSHKAALTLAFGERDICAKGVVANKEAHAVFALMRPELAEKVLGEADKEYLRELCAFYKENSASFLSTEKAQKLHENLGQKSLYFILKEAGIEPQKALFDIALGAAVLKKEVSSSTDPEKLRTHIQGYLDINREAAGLWQKASDFAKESRKLEKEAEKFEKLYPSEKLHEQQEAIKTFQKEGWAARKEAILAFEKRDIYAQTILANTESKVVLDLLRPSIAKKVPLHASKELVRELCREYAAQTERDPRMETAASLVKNLKDRAHYRIVRDKGFEIQRLRFEAAFGEAIQEKIIPYATDPEKIYPQARKYMDLHLTAAKLWREFKEGNTNIQETAVKAFKTRDQFLDTIDQKEVHAVLSVLYPKLVQSLEKASFKKTSRSSHSFENDRSDPLKGRKAPSFSTEQILYEAKNHYASLARSLLGAENPRTSTANVLRFGDKNGSLFVTIAGPKTGAWYDFAAGEGGNIFSLVQREKGCNFKESVEYLGQQLGLVPGNTFKEDLKTPVEKIKEEKVESDAEQVKKLAAVLSLHRQSMPLQGTAALKYLRNERKITTSLPDDIRSLPANTRFLYGDKQRVLFHETLAVFARDKDGLILSVQLTHLREDGTRATYPTGEKMAKIKYGIGKEAVVTLQSKPESQTVIIAEGLETALSIKETGIEATIIASQGIHNIKNYQGPEKHVVLAADNDDHKPNSGTHKVISAAQEHFKAQGKDVTIIKPETPGDDFNDVLKKQGVEKIDEHLCPVRAYQAISKIEGLKKQLKGKLSENDREFLKQDLKYEMKSLKHDPDVLSRIKSTNPDLGREVDRAMANDRTRGR